MNNMNESIISFDSKDDIMLTHVNVASGGAGTETGFYYNKEDDYFSKISQKIPYKYAEDQILADLKAYIDKTYGQHYKTSSQFECLDAWLALGDATSTFRDTAIKYLWRYGKKNGNNKDDLMKAMHYVLLAMYSDHYKKD